jgi:YD repeat-containing protein
MTENIYNMTGEPIYTYNIDSGRRWLLNDVAGKPIRFWDNQHRETRNSYDALQRPIETSLCLGAFVVNLVEKTVYGTSASNNQKGQIAEQYDQSGKTHFTAYNFKGNLLSLAKQLCHDYKQTIDWNSSPALETEIFAQSFTYDAMNRPINITKPDNSVIAHSYNKAGLLESVQARLRDSTSWTDFVRDINYNEKGQRTEIYFGNNSKTKYEYDEKTFRLTRLLTTRNSGRDILQDLNYAYDPVGNITRVEDDAQQTFYFDNAVIAPTGTYTYDALYRLTEATGRELKGLAMPTNTDFVNNIALPNPAANTMQNYTQQYQYDELGNIQRMQSKGYWARDYFYNEGVNTLKGHTSGATDYRYDAHGNSTAMLHLSSMQWDYKNQLKEADLGGGGDVWYVYDASGQRVRKVIEKTGGIVEQRIYLGGCEVYRKTISGNLNFERETLRITD